MVGERRDELARVTSRLQLQGHRPADEGRQAVRRRAQPRPPGEAAAHGRQPAAARRADERPRRRHAARAGGGAARVRRLRSRDLPRSLVPRPHRDARARVRGRLAGALVRGQLRGLRGGAPRAPRRRGRPPAPHPVQETRAVVAARSPRARATASWLASQSAALGSGCMGDVSKAVLITGCSSGHRPGDGAAARRGRLDGLRDRAPAGVDRGPGGGRLPHARAGRDRRGLDGRRGARSRGDARRGRRADQQRRLLAERRDRDGAAGCGAASVRDERVRARAADAARAAEDARPALGQDRQPRLDGRPARVPRRRLVPRDEARARGDQRRAALRGARLRDRRDPARAGPDHDRVRQGGGQRAWRASRRRDSRGDPYAQVQRDRRQSATQGAYTARCACSAPAPSASRR